jgi:tetratricopeptide (TPR) repeat protein
MSYAQNLATGGKIPEAISAYTRLIEDYPEEYILYQYLGIAHGVSGNLTGSIENLEKAISLNPTPVAYFNLAVAYKETGRTEEAIRCFENYLANPEREDAASIRSVQAEVARLKKAVKR